MNPVLIKSLLGVGVLGTTVAASVGGYYWLSAPNTIGEKLKEKELVAPYVESDSDTTNKNLWTARKNAYAANTDTKNKKILETAGVTEKALSDKCKEILKTSLNASDVEEKEAWAKKWCLKNSDTNS